MAMLKKLYMDLNMNHNQCDGYEPKYELQLVCMEWAKIWYISNELKYDKEKAQNPR